MNAVTLDQFSVFVAIVEEGSFAAAARRLNRAQSAVTYTIQKLEEQSGIALFDRSAYRPVLTEAGHALLPRARRIVADVAEYRLQARGIAEGLEAELSLVVDALAPMPLVVPALKAFHETFPLVQTRISVESLGASARALSDGSAEVGVLNDFPGLTSEFERNFFCEVDLAAVAAPDHPLARLRGPIEPELLRDHVQLVLTSRASARDGRDFGVHAAHCWHLTDSETKHALLLAGLGWGSLPRHRVAEDLAAGRLVELQPARWEGTDRMPQFRFVVAYRKDKALGPAGRWLFARLTQAAVADWSDR